MSSEPPETPSGAAPAAGDPDAEPESVTQLSPEEQAAAEASAEAPAFRVHLSRTDENVEEIEALARMLGRPVGLDGLLDGLKYQARPARLPRLLGRAVHRGFAFDDYDQRDASWWPQGISTSADASDPQVIGADREVLVVTWYSKQEMGSRVTFIDLKTLRYRHVLLVEPVFDEDRRLVLKPVRIHAGGIVWCGPWLHVAATARGFVTCRVDDIMAVEGDDDRPDQLGVLDGGRIASFGHHYVLPVRFRYQAHAEDKQERLRYSFLSLDRESDPPVLLAGEYGRGPASTRLARYRLDPETALLATGEDGTSRPTGVDDGGVQYTQGAVVARGRYHLSVSRGPWIPGSVYVGRPGAMREHPFATPFGPEDFSFWPATDELWSVTEWPRKRWFFAMKRSWFDRTRWLDRQGWAQDLPVRVEKLMVRLTGRGFLKD